MSRHALLASLTIEHEFFADTRCRMLVCEPDPASIKLARDCELVLKTNTHGATVYFDQDRTEAFALAAADSASPPELWFRLYAADTTFANCTFPTTPRSGAVLLFSNAGELPLAATQRQSLAKGDTVSGDDFVPLDNAAVADVLTAHDRRIPPLALVCIQLGGMFPHNYLLRFEARQTFWKYYVLGDLARPSASIVDTRREMEFAAGVETTLADNRRALAFTSKTRIPLRQHSDRHFQLRENGTGIDKVLIRHLPVAASDGLYKDMINGQEELVSDIYINC